MNSELIKKYIYAVSCHLPPKAQEEVEKDLEAMIFELLDARCGDRAPTEEDIRIVLTELGSPEKLAVKYSGDENKALISGIYLLWFKKILKIILPIVAGAVALGTAITAFTKWDSTLKPTYFVAEQFAAIIYGAIEGALQAAFWILIVFIILERKNVDFSSKDFLSRLPNVPDKRAQIKIHEPILDIFWHIAAAVLFLGFPYLIGGYTEGTGWVAAFNQSYIQSVWYLVVLFAAIGIFNEIFTLTERRYSKRLALVTAISNILTGGLSALFFANSKIMNPEFDEIVISLFKLNGEEAGGYLPPINLVLLGIIIFALLLEIGVTAFRAFRYDK